MRRSLSLLKANHEVPNGRPRALGCAARDIFAFLRRNLAPYKRVRRIQFADLPKTISGKCFMPTSQ